MNEKKIKYNIHVLDCAQLKERQCIKEEIINMFAYVKKLIIWKGVNSHEYKINIIYPITLLSKRVIEWSRQKKICSVG